MLSFIVGLLIGLVVGNEFGAQIETWVKTQWAKVRKRN